MLSELVRTLIDGVTPQPPRHFQRSVAPRYYERRATGTLDADYLHSVVTQSREGQMMPLLALYRDIETADDVINGALATRKLAVLSDAPSVVPCRKGVLEDQRAADAFARCLDSSPTWLDGMNHLLNGCLWPVAVSQVRWIPGQLDYAKFELRQVPLEQLDYRTGALRIARVDSSGSVLTDSDALDPARYICHRGHLGTHPDTWGGPFRALLFWHLFGACDRDWWARFLERFGAPFLVGKYDPDDEESRLNLINAFSESARTFGIVATSETSVELHEAGSAVGADSFAKFLDIATAAKTRLILGQTLSSKADATGMGSGTANLQGAVRTEYRQWDRLSLSATVRRSLIEPFMLNNRLPGEAPKLRFPGDPADLAQIGSFLQTAKAAGLEITDDGIDALNDQTGVTLQRAAPSADSFPHPNQAALPPLLASIFAASLPPSVIATGSAARNAAADYRQALGSDHADVSRIIASATSVSDLRDRLEAHFASLARPATARVLTESATAGAVNAAV